MHSRAFLQREDFRFDGPLATVGESFIQRCRPNDRVVVVAPEPARDLAATAGLILALVHAFYDRSAAREAGFFDYPPLYVIGGKPEAEPALLHPATSEWWGEAWCQLDVWPTTHHAIAAPSAESLMRAVFMLEPTCLVWPHRLAVPPAFAPSPSAVAPDQADMDRLLHQRLREVQVYADGTGLAEGWRIHIGGGALELGKRALERLPETARPAATTLSAATFRTIEVDDFLPCRGPRET